MLDTDVWKVINIADDCSQASGKCWSSPPLEAREVEKPRNFIEVALIMIWVAVSFYSTFRESDRNVQRLCSEGYENKSNQFRWILEQWLWKNLADIGGDFF